MVANQMTRKGSLLNDLRVWFDAQEISLIDNGYHAEFANSPSDRGKQSASVTITSAQRIGQLVIWDTGEAELSMGDVASALVAEEHREITSEIGLQDAIQTLTTWLTESR